MIEQILFVLVTGLGAWGFARSVGKIRRNIQLGREEDRTDNAPARWRNMARVAMGQSKMGTRPVAAFFHVLIYVGFILINIEVLEIFLDGLLGTHRILSVLGPVYHAAISFFELLAVGVLAACVVFLWRRNVSKVGRFSGLEMTGFPVKDANTILIVEVVLMAALLFMNAAEARLYDLQIAAGMGLLGEAKEAGWIISNLLSPIYGEATPEGLHLAERVLWWLHWLGILAFLNYLPFSKHFHIIMAFPNTWYASLNPAGQLNNMPEVTKEVKLMLDPNANPYAAPAEGEASAPKRFGAKDVTDLSWKSLMDAYTCTECGRCTSVCPANTTGKKLSPRKIMMDTRDRLEEVGRNLDAHGMDFTDNKALLGDYISKEEIRACTTCNACVEACPVQINPVNIIVELRRYMMMEESDVPAEWAGMFGNVQNNGAPWQFPAADRASWMQKS